MLQSSFTAQRDFDKLHSSTSKRIATRKKNQRLYTTERLFCSVLSVSLSLCYLGRFCLSCAVLSCQRQHHEHQQHKKNVGYNSNKTVASIEEFFVTHEIETAIDFNNLYYLLTVRRAYLPRSVPPGTQEYTNIDNPFL